MTQLSDIKLTGLRKSNLTAASLLVLPAILGSCFLVSLTQSGIVYWLGQFVGAVFFMQAFILLHEFGHRSMFTNNKVNTFFGHFFSFLVFIPYYNWREIHNLHHKWTGYRDLDPTTEKTFADRLNKKQEALINTAWKYSLPLFTLGYRFGIYWKAEKLRRHLSPSQYQKCIRSMILYGALYFVVLVLAPSFVLSLLPALLMSFVLCDILSLSQHSHIEMKHSGGEAVKPLKYADQLEFSRSLIFPDWMSEYLLFNFNYHELHHAYPGLPCYHLDKFQERTPNSYYFLPWLRRVKKIDGVDFIFRSNSDRSEF